MAKGEDKRTRQSEKQEHQKKIRKDQTAAPLTWPHTFAHIIGVLFISITPINQNHYIINDTSQPVANKAIFSPSIIYFSNAEPAKSWQKYPC